MSIGVLDIQGSVEEHLACLKKCGIKPVAVKSAEQITQLSGLIIPGGESTTIGDLMKAYGLEKELQAHSDLPIWGTCAGAILLARMKIMDIEVERNAYGSQLNSFEADVEIGLSNQKSKFHAIFIRAPRIISASNRAKILAEYEGSPIMVQEGSKLATTFHPELTDDLRIHQYFLNLCNASNNR
ncbi:pyridoxal 5'-phosphate synthase glutaminase subunit PdxT [Candidatus Peregrinibacteria bacterium CG11_big_fil_rev_8_21_14_0_20_46_8]|nr:MAG: pyridoxal 5'-phosphate synthase glutaminase subunit PdxT [Candidatus Peregrinibacteria bacterium CG11_big_fil_rev_8_21_14_0_20_46_8]